MEGTPPGPLERLATREVDVSCASRSRLEADAEDPEDAELEEEVRAAETNGARSASRDAPAASTAAPGAADRA